MHLDELARDEIQRLAVVAGEIQVAHAGREHAAADQPQREMVATRSGTKRASSYNKRPPGVVPRYNTRPDLS